MSVWNRLVRLMPQRLSKNFNMQCGTGPALQLLSLRGIAMDVDAMAHAMFSAYHAHYGRFRDWKRAPMQDVGPEMGKQTFLLMAQAVADMPAPEVEATV